VDSHGILGTLRRDGFNAATCSPLEKIPQPCEFNDLFSRQNSGD